MIFGGIFAAAISIYEVGPPATRLLLMGSAAALGGALWVLLPVFLKIRFRVNEIIATLLLNYVAMYSCSTFCTAHGRTPRRRFRNRRRSAPSSG